MPIQDGIEKLTLFVFIHIHMFIYENYSAVLQ